MKNLNNITIVGGGTAGFVAALILNVRFPSVNISVIRSKRIGIVGVGEGSTEQWKHFMEYVSIDEKEMIKECDCTFKSGIMFRGWSDDDYLHSIIADLSKVTCGQNLPVYNKLVADKFNNKFFNEEESWHNRIPEEMFFNGNIPVNQYHFNTHKLNDYLTNLSLKRRISVIDDEILDVQLNENGEVDKLVGENDTYSSDFYIDCTGFSRLIISKLGAKWKSHSQYLKMKSAIVFSLGDTEEYNLWTLAQAMDYGWMFKIPTWGRSGNGYIFDSDYITAEQAKEEVEKFLGHKIEVNKEFKFDPGCLDKVWIKNCCAIGLSANFVEPLEASSIGTSIQQTFLLMHRLPNYSQTTIDQYNDSCEKILLNIRDFIVLHYITNKENSEFWKDLKKMKLPESLKKNLERWEHNMPIREDFSDVGGYGLFYELHFVQILNGLKLFNTQSIKKEYDLFPKNIRKSVDDFLTLRKFNQKNMPTFGHKEFISLIRGEKKLDKVKKV